MPFLGFFLLPWTTLAYAVMWSVGSNRVNGFEWFIVILAFLFDLGSYAEGRRGRRAPRAEPSRRRRHLFDREGEPDVLLGERR